jgi:branched-chain amino acid transport system substrate-binding protein
MIKEKKESRGRGLSRRGALKLAAGALCAPAVLRVLPANAQSAAIKIGYVSPKTGPIAAFSESDCSFSWNRDPATGLIFVQSGPLG